MDYKRLLALCQDRTVWIQTHNFPDPDAVSSAYGLSEFLKHFGIKTKLCYDGEIDKLSTSKMLSIFKLEMYSKEEIRSMTENSLIVLVDCQKNAGNTTDLIGIEAAVIDHHPVYAEASYEYADLRITGACASMIAEYYRDAGFSPSSKVATALLYGMRMDTLQFSRGVTPFDIEMFDYLFPQIDNRLLKKLETNNMEFTDLRGYGVAIENFKVYGRVGFSYLDFKCPDALVGILSDFLLSLVEVDVVILYAKRDNGVKFSFRSERSDVHAGDLAAAGLKDWGNGGGHAAMAGGFVKNVKLPEDPETRFETIQAHFIDLMRDMCPQVL